MAYDMAATFTSLPGHSAQVEIVKGAPYALSIISEFVPRVNALLAAQVEHVELDEPSSPTSPLQSRGPPLPPVPGVARIELDRESTMREALERLMHLAGPKLARSLALSQRDPNSVMSFSLRTPDKEALAYEKYVHCSDCQA
ncbi:hypothetical protein DL93DRAFT_2070014 [Clavulina sp. PMI_390]|nr:hypothetical protein DL93DRAFT_2070014 [Clavulina sp. PMI_390]